MEWTSVTDLQLQSKHQAHSSRWATDSSPDFAFSSSEKLLPGVREQWVLEVFLKSQHWPLVITIDLWLLNSFPEIPLGRLQVWWKVFQAELETSVSELVELDLTCQANINDSYQVSCELLEAVTMKSVSRSYWADSISSCDRQKLLSSTRNQNMLVTNKGLLIKASSFLTAVSDQEQLMERDYHRDGRCSFWLGSLADH